MRPWTGAALWYWLSQGDQRGAEQEPPPWRQLDVNMTFSTGTGAGTQPSLGKSSQCLSLLSPRLLLSRDRELTVSVNALGVPQGEEGPRHPSAGTHILMVVPIPCHVPWSFASLP